MPHLKRRRAIRAPKRSVGLWLAMWLPLPRAQDADASIYGGYYASTSTPAYAEVSARCFSGLALGVCSPLEPGWLSDYLDQYNTVSSGLYCLSCCSNTDTSGNTWVFTCPLSSTAFVDFTNLFGYEFRFARRETADDTTIISCELPRSACSYDSTGDLVGTCSGDSSYLVSYTLSMDILTVESGLTSWKSVQACSVTTEESDTAPTALGETIVMTQVYGAQPGIEAGYVILYVAVTFLALSCLVRCVRRDACTVCGYRLVWFRGVCLPCRFYGYRAPSKAAMAVDDHEAFGGEVVCTFVLVMAYFTARDAQMATKMPHVQGLLPLFIGLSVFIGYLAMLPIDLGSLNPARSFATSVTTDEFDDHWVFWIGPFVGAMFAAVFWEGLLRPPQPEQEEPTTA